jgi:hypothetical protein
MACWRDWIAHQTATAARAAERVCSFSATTPITTTSAAAATTNTNAA